MFILECGIEQITIKFQIEVLYMKIVQLLKKKSIKNVESAPCKVKLPISSLLNAHNTFIEFVFSDSIKLVKAGKLKFLIKILLVDLI